MNLPPPALPASSVRPYKSLHESLEAIVACLRLAVPFRVWMISRISGDDQTVLSVADREQKINHGLVLRWSDSFCQMMVQQPAPPAVIDVQSTPGYQEAGAHRHLQVGAYIGQPLMLDDGRLIGTLCALDPDKQQQMHPDQVQMVAYLSRIVSTLIASAMQVEKSRQIEAGLRYQANTDALTQLANRNAWTQAMVEEESALDGLAENAMVAIIDLDGLKRINDTSGHAEGDGYLVQAAQALRKLVDAGHVVARIGGDEFAILARGLNEAEAIELKSSIAAALQAVGVNASIGIAMRLSHGSLSEALREADARMYEEKAQRRRLLQQAQKKSEGS